MWLENLEMRLIGVVTNLELTKKVTVIFYNLRGYDSNLTFCEYNKLDVKIDVIPNRLEINMTFFKQKLNLY